jgi:Zn-finger nucleic acid-binding protein
VTAQHQDEPPLDPYVLANARHEDPMPLIMCPNCNASMQEVKREDVAIDMCPSCRGVWLDRGELEKLLAGVREVRAEAQKFETERQDFYRDPDAYRRAHPQQPPTYGGYGERGERGERGEHGERGHDPRYRKKRGFDMFDIFD